MAYEKQTWTAGDAITKQRMDHIEDGIAAAAVAADVNNELARKINQNAIVNNLDATSGGENTGFVLDAYQGKVLKGMIDQVSLDFSADGQKIAQGAAAYEAIVKATTAVDPNPYSSLVARFDAIDSTIESAVDNLKKTLGTIVDPETNVASPAYSTTNTVYKAIQSLEAIAQEVRTARINGAPTGGETYDSLYAHLTAINTKLSDLRANVTSIESAAGINTETGEPYTLTYRINQLQSIANEIEAAHRTASDTLSQRFGAIEQAASDLAATVSTLDTDVVKKADVKDNFSSNDTNLPLSALKGKELRQMIGGNFDATNTVAKAIIDAQNTAQTNAIDHADDNKVDKTNIYNDLDYVPAQDATDDKVLDARQGKALKDLIDSMDTAYKAADTALDGRVSDVEDAIDTLNGDASTEGSVLNTVNTQIAAVVAEAPEAFDTLKEIADWIDGHSTDALEMQQDISDNADAITALQNTVGDENSGLVATANTALSKANAAAVKTEVDSSLSGLNTRLNAVDGGEALTNEKTLATRVSEAESAITNLQREPKSATEVISVENFEALEANEANSHKDYLVGPDSNNLYKYYHIIETSDNVYEKVLISGGGSGSGNTSGINLTAAEYATLKENKAYAENTDYYVLEEDGIRHHYRYIATTVNDETTLSEIEIGLVVDTDQIKKYNINRVTGKKREYNSQTQTWTETDEDVEYLNLYQYDYDEDNSIIDTDRPYFAQIELPKGGGDGGSSSSQKNILTRIGSEVVQKVTGSQILLRVFFSSYDATGTESSVGYATLRVGNNTIFSNRELSSYESSIVPSPLTWQENTAGFHEFDVTDYCEAGNTLFTLTVNVGGSAPLGKTWRVNLTELRLESDAPDNLLISVDDEYAFPYTPIGAVSKNLIVTIDKNTENESTRTVSIPSNVSGTPSTYIFEDDLNLTHGKHTIEMQLSALIGGVTEYSNKINREYIWYDVNDTETPIIIASQYEGITIEEIQYATIEIPYQVYKKGASIINVEYYLDDSETPYQTSTLTNTNTGTLAYIAADTGNHSLQIKVDNVAITINLKIAKSDKDLSPISGMVIDFDPITLSNNAANRLPQWNARINQTNYTYKLTASPNFNWSDAPNGGGYKKDSNGDRCFVIKAGSYVDLDYPMFAHDVFGNGAEMKITFKTSAVRNAEAVWYKNVGEISGKAVGIQLSTHSGWLKTDKAVATTTSADEDEDEGTITVKGITYTYWQPNTEYSIDDVRVIRNIIYRCINDTDTSVDYDLQDKSIDLDAKPYKNYMKKWAKIGQLDTEIIATNSYLYFPYSEEDKIELDININKSNSGNDFIMSYEDGVPSKAYAYTTGAGGDKIAHNGTIRIGSDECDVYIYHLRYYVKSLSTDQILQNFIADGKDLNQKVERYERNCIYWNPYMNDGNGGYTLTKTSQSYLDPIKLAEKMPDVKILMLDTDVFTTSKKDFVMNSTLRCVHAAGGNIYKSRGDEDNWLFINGFHAGQGTTSDNYGQSARNVDFLFEVDGKHWPSKAGNMGNYTMAGNPNYISAVIKGEEASEFANNSWNAPQNKWTANTAYEIGDKVVISEGISGTVYACTKAHTSDETFDVKNWNQIGTISKCTDWMEDNCKITLTESSVPNNYFNFKANVASSENVNNALFQKRYNDFLTYSSPAQHNQIEKHYDTYENIDKVKVKNCMEFVPAVLFVREHAVDSSGNPEGHVEFNDTNWHFYALGNIGDSKKSDYTRAYDPDDMNEFTCENSDNNTNNGQFQSGVFMYDDHEAIETDYRAWSDTAEYNTGDIVVYNGMVYTCNTAATVGTWISAEWSIINYTGWTDNKLPYFAPRSNPNPMDYIYPISPSQWNVKFGDEYLNRKHTTLLTEEFDGDHSFEFRYACCGDYRDGDRINDTHGDSDVPVDSNDLTKGYKTKDDVQEELNHDVVLAFYEWLVTSTPEQYSSEAPQWFVKNAMEFFYAYTHYYTMMDNRAKNTFWHFAKTGTYIKVSRPVKELLHIYEVPDGNGGYKKTTDTELDPANPYYTQYAFDLWVYDCDTAAGIDNNGALVFPYGKEDEDYRVDGQASSGYAFNGAGSIFWRRLKNVFKDEIASVMTQPSKNCFDPEHLINEFDSFQNCFPEEVWRLDIERKYIRTYTGQSIDGSITTNKQNARFLMSMMQGRKKYQRRQWIRDQSFYFNSKYKIGEIDVNRTEFNIVSPAGDHSLLPVVPDYHLHLTPYQDMYLNVVVGNGSPIPPIRAKANKEYIIKLDDYTAGNFQETRVYISGFRMISKLGGLASMYPYSFTLNGLDHLKELDIGTEESGYTNGNFTELPLTDQVSLPLLEKLNIKNCNSLSNSIGLKTANNLRVVEAAGSNIGGISLPDYTQIEILHLPISVTDVILNNARFLRDFTITDITGAENYNNLYTLNVIDSDYSGIYTWKENTEYAVNDIIVIGNNVYKCKTTHTSVASSVQSNTTTWDNYLKTNWTLIKANIKLPVDWLDIATQMLQKQSLQTDLQLLELSTATIGDIQELQPFNEFKSTLENNGGILELSGIIHITGAWSEIERDNYMTVWPRLTFDTSAGTKQIKHKVTYKYDAYEDNDGNIINGDIIKELYVNDGATAPDIYSNGTLSEMPHRDPTVRVSYEFGSIDTLTDSYIPYSGWQLSGSTTSLYEAGGAPIIRQNTVIETHFETVSRSYYVKWFMNEDPASLVKTSIAPVAYGEGYDLEAPTVAEIHAAGQTTCSVNTDTNGQATYSIFNGWEKLPTNITPSANDETYNIYATYDTGTVVIDDLFATNNLDNLTPVQLLVLSALDSTGRATYGINSSPTSKILAGKRVTYTMGQDSIAEGTTLVSGNPLRLDGANDASYATPIQPLKAGNDAFTLAIDYCFNPNATYGNSAAFAVLASVYYGSTTEGIRNGLSLFYGLNSSIYGLRVGWGDMYSQASQSKIVGNTTNMGQRNIIVLRHPKGSNTLYIYSGLNGNINTPENVEVQTLDWSNYNSNAYLNFGRLTSETTDGADDIPNTVVNGKGTIFWAKYWPEDLGIGECKRLAAWPHETITYAISQLNNNSTSTTRVSSSTTVPITPSIYLSALTASSHIKIAQSRAQGITNFSARDYSVVRPLCNKRIFSGLPTNIQAIMCQPNVRYTQVVYSFDSNSGNASYQLNENNSLLGKDYVFQYSAGNLTNKVATYISREDGNFPWLKEPISTYSYNSSSGWTYNSDDTNPYYMNIRSPFKALNWSGANKTRIFREFETRVPSNLQIAYSIMTSTGEIRSGDIYIDTSNQTYIYVLTSEIQALGIQIMPTTGDYAKFNTSNLSDSSLRGGWVRAEDYWTRSAIAGSNAENFAFVNEHGDVETSATNSASTTGLNVMYTFAI